MARGKLTLHSLSNFLRLERMDKDPNQPYPKGGKVPTGTQRLDNKTVKFRSELWKNPIDVR